MQVVAAMPVFISPAVAPAPVPVEYEPYISKPECARRMGKSVRALESYMALGIVPFFKLGRSVVFKWSEVDLYICEHLRVCIGGSK